jgi:hypothetical protein
MATNLVSLVMQFLTPDMVGRIAAALGFDRNKILSAISGAVPALLAAYNDVATQPGGAQKLAVRIASLPAAVAVRPASPREFKRPVPLSKLSKPEGNAAAVAGTKMH